MAYGISITGNDTAGDFIVQDTSIGSGIINYQVVAEGQTLTSSISSFSGNARLFINGNSKKFKYFLYLNILINYFKNLNFINY